MRTVTLKRVTLRAHGVLEFLWDKYDDVANTHEPHRSSLVPGIPASRQLALVNAHLQSMGWPEVDSAGVQVIESAVIQRHTPAVVTAYLARVAALDLVVP